MNSNFDITQTNSNQSEKTTKEQSLILTITKHTKQTMEDLEANHNISSKPENDPVTLSYDGIKPQQGTFLVLNNIGESEKNERSLQQQKIDKKLDNINYTSHSFSFYNYFFTFFSNFSRSDRYDLLEYKERSEVNKHMKRNNKTIYLVKIIALIYGYIGSISFAVTACYLLQTYTFEGEVIINIVLSAIASLFCMVMFYIFLKNICKPKIKDIHFIFLFFCFFLVYMSIVNASLLLFLKSTKIEALK